MSAETSGITGNLGGHDSSQSALWLGPGTLFEDLAPVLGALAGPASPTRLAVEALGDLDRLFDPAPPTGRLLIDDSDLALEDVGLLRRFLRRHPGWHLVVCGQDPRERTARALSGEERTRWMAWPLDFDQMRWLVSSESGAGGNGSPAPRAAAAAPQTTPATGVSAGAGGPSFDAGELLEESLASAALAGDDPPRFAYRSEGSLKVTLGEAAVAPLVESLLTIARGCAGEGADISVLARGSGGEVTVDLTFPAGPLAKLRAGTDLTATTLSEELDGEAGVAALELAGAMDAAPGARLEVSRSGGSVRVRLILPG